MMLFWLICAGLVGIALAFILPTLLERVPSGTVEAERKEANLDVYRDQLSELDADLRNGITSPEQYRQDRDEIERRLLEDISSSKETVGRKPKPATSRGSVYAIAASIPVAAVVLYLLIGNSAAMRGGATPAQAPTTPSSQTGQQMSQQQIEANVAALAKRMEQNPGDAEGWTMLARSYMIMEKYSEATNAYAKASALKPRDADLMADYAFAMAMANGRQLQGEPLQLVKKALQIDPENAKALDLAASAEFQAKNYEKAIDYWQQVLKKTPSDSELAGRLAQNILEAKSLASTNAK